PARQRKPPSSGAPSTTPSAGRRTAASAAASSACWAEPARSTDGKTSVDSYKELLYTYCHCAASAARSTPDQAALPNEGLKTSNIQGTGGRGKAEARGREPHRGRQRPQVLRRPLEEPRQSRRRRRLQRLAGRDRGPARTERGGQDHHDQDDVR